nr:extracellular solute-binding protein [uncultured Anaerocolumna sp.]
MKLVKKVLSLGLLCILAVSLVGCGDKKKTVDTEKEQVSEKGDGADRDSSTLKTIDQIKLGEDYKDIKATIKFLTNRTDLVDTIFADYIKKFQKIYPGINIEYEAATDYFEDITIRLTTDNWGDICMIPTTIDKNELPNLFVSFGDKPSLDKEYIMLNNFSYQDKVYGIPSTGTAQGIVYNKKVFEKAGITEMPRTPDDFLAVLQKIKDNTDAIPMYSNFAANWTMTAWDAYIGGSATGDPDFMNNGLVHGKNPFSKRDDMTGPYAVYYVLYEATARGLIEDDPTTTDWEGCKGMINNGEIGTMVLGSWAVTQMQEAGENGDDIGYMPFPITINGKQYATAGPDYNYGININSSEENKIASMLYIKWLTEESNFAYDQGGIPIKVGAEYPDVLSAFDGVDLVIDNPAAPGEETFFNDINNESEIGLNVDNYHVSQVLEHALTGDMTLDEIVADWNAKWSKAQEKFSIKVR